MADAGNRDPDALMRRAGMFGDRHRDQHFLVDDRVIDRIAGYAEDHGATGTTLEVGAGTGALTDRLLTVADRVVAVERDRELAAFLAREFAAAVDADRLSIVPEDALTADLPHFDAVVSNLPYGVASEIIFRLLPAGVPMVVMVQREFADRVTATAGTAAYGRATVTVGLRADADILEVVPASAFQPPPPVESAILALTPREPPDTIEDESAFLDLVTAVFTQRRKTLRNAIRNTTHISGIEDASAVVAALPTGWGDRRPETITPDEFATIAAIAYGWST